LEHHDSVVNVNQCNHTHELHVCLVHLHDKKLVRRANIAHDRTGSVQTG
jgi:hypothetical protein